MANMPIQIHQLVEQQIHTHLLTRILCTLNEISFKLQNPDHEIDPRSFNRDEVKILVDELRKGVQNYYHDQLPNSSV